ncbi:MAG: nucleotidyltransferase domain-containing protein [Defluviitaleaceae bacterium]|nr:nucleotidyltransferase domain-containing protein [Defluviitaleaceae bacterium]
MIKDTILQKLRQAEETHQIKIPLAVESGSRGWGLAAHDADYDCRFIYVHTRDWYLSVMPQKDYIECASDAVFDINGWDIKKFITHIVKSNAVTSEWLSSNAIYIKETAITKPLQDLAAAFFNPISASYHYLNTAKNKLAEITSSENANVKKYFYALRPLASLQYIWQHGKMPPMEYENTLTAIDIPAQIQNKIQELLAEKRQATEWHLIPNNTEVITYIKNEVEQAAERLKSMKHEKCKDYALADKVFRNTIEKMWQNG